VKQLLISRVEGGQADHLLLLGLVAKSDHREDVGAEEVDVGLALLKVALSINASEIVGLQFVRAGDGREVQHLVGRTFAARVADLSQAGFVLQEAKLLQASVASAGQTAADVGVHKALHPGRNWPGAIGSEPRSLYFPERLVQGIPSLPRDQHEVSQIDNAGLSAELPQDLLAQL
jgi:hypothetical protein